MGAFQFRLQPVLRLRERERDQAADHYRQALDAKQKLESEVERLLKEHADQAPEQTDASRGQVDAQRMLESQRFQLYLMGEVKQLRETIQTIETECERRRGELVKREQALHAMEKLKENQLAEWQQESIRQEQISIDAWAGFRHWQNGVETNE